MILRSSVALKALAPYSLLVSVFVSFLFLRPRGSGWHRRNDLFLLGRSAGDELFVVLFVFCRRVLFQVLGLQKLPRCQVGREFL